mmetsp:Transcript_23037/g.17473  ORF Transcript_23037/g.17473 Transcript_23037/m.17473 type:complete len:205 (-) Transcript_23037:31-645(-)
MTSTRSTSFGYGERMQPSSRMRESPSPDHYDIKSSFEVSKSQSSKRKHNISFCFGAGREAYRKVVMPANKYLADECVPGPGSYKLQPHLGLHSRKFTFGDRFLFNDVTHNEKKKGFPGPGQYEDILRIDKVGTYKVSTFLNSRASNFSKGERFKESSKLKELPGPGTYETIGTIEKNGKQVASHFKNVAVRRFGSEERPDPSKF